MMSGTDIIRSISSSEKDRQIELNSHKMNKLESELSAFSQKGGNSVTQTTEYIFYLQEKVVSETLQDI